MPHRKTKWSVGARSFTCVGAGEARSPKWILAQHRSRSSLPLHIVHVHDSFTFKSPPRKTHNHRSRGDTTVEGADCKKTSGGGADSTGMNSVAFGLLVPCRVCVRSPGVFEPV